MDIEKISVELRQRSAWEALDLGFAIARQWWPTLLASLVLVAGPITLVVSFLCVEVPWLGLMILWWLKPLFERMPLLIISRRFFGERLGPLEAVRMVDRAFLAGLLGLLTWRRLSPLRSYLAPVEALEGLWGPERRARANLIARSQTAAAGSLTYFFFFVEVVIFFAVFVLLAMIIPGETHFGEWLGDFFRGESGWHLILANVIYVAAMVTVMPFYAAAGFALYINRRVDLEGWDIDLAFRRMARRLHKVGLAAVGVLLVALVSAAPARADPGEASLAEVRAAAEKVIQHEDFGGEQLDLVWKPIAPPEPKDSRFDLDGELSLPEAPNFGFGSIFVWLIGIAGAVTLFFLIRAIYRGRAERQRATTIEHHPPETLFGLDIRPQSLPKDVVAAVRRAWRDGDAELALSLLYRAALARLTADTTIEIPKSATEGECIDLVAQQVDEAIAGDFATLTHAWVHTAYGDRPPEEPAFLDMLEHWAGHLGGTR